MKLLKIENSAGFALVDDADHERLSRYKWYLSKRDFCQYARRKEWVNGKRVDILMHRDIVDYRIEGGSSFRRPSGQNVHINRQSEIKTRARGHNMG